VDEDLRAQVKARRDSRRAQPWREPARARVMWTHLYSNKYDPEQGWIKSAREPDMGHQNFQTVQRLLIKFATK
jgi:hypothetical protein